MPTTSKAERIHAIVTAVVQCGFRDGHEFDMHNAIASALIAAGIEHTLEFSLGARDRVDFMCEFGTAIECKVDGASQAVARQLLRYAEHDEVQQLILATTKSRHAKDIPDNIGGKPVTVVLFRILP